MRDDTIFIIVTIGARINSYTLKKLAFGWREPKLKPNQYAYRFHIKTEEKDWKQRIADISLNIPQVRPPELKDASLDVKVVVGKDIPTLVMERLSQ